MNLIYAYRRLVSGHLLYSFSAKLKGLDLSSASVEAIGLNPAESNFHSNSGGPLLRKIMREIPIPKGSRIIDFGSGKGGATFTLGEFPFDEVLGIELSERLIEIAKRNRAILKPKNVYFEHRSATELTIDLDRFSHFYFFNPFAPSVVQKVCDNLKASIDRQPRAITLLCKYPEGHLEQCFKFDDRLRLVRTIQPKFSHPFYILEMLPGSV